MTVRRFLSAVVFLTLTATVMPAFAETLAADQGDTRRPGQLARQGMDSVLRAFDRFVGALPQYALPEITDQGDIIIRRTSPRADALEKEFPDDAVKNI